MPGAWEATEEERREYRKRSRTVGKITLSAFARKHGVSKSAVGNAIKRGDLAVERVEDPIYGVRVMIDEDAALPPGPGRGRPLGSVNLKPRRPKLKRAGGTPTAVARSRALRRVSR
jgi:hypothetical protein